MKPPFVRQHCYLVEVTTDSFLLLCDLIQPVRYDDLLVQCRPENEVAEGQLVPLSFVVYPLILIIGTADCDRSVAFSHCITLLSLCDFCEGARGSPRPASVRRTAECDAGISYLRRLYGSVSGSFLLMPMPSTFAPRCATIAFVCVGGITTRFLYRRQKWAFLCVTVTQL